MAADPFAEDFDPADNNTSDTKENTSVTDAPFDTTPQQPTGEISLTFKGDGNFYSPWIVLRGPDAATVNELLNEELQELMKNSTKYAKAHFTLASSIKGDAPASGGGGGGRPAASASTHPTGREEFCKHGKMEYKSGVSKAGKAYKVFSCTAPRDEQCKGVFDND